MDRVAQKATWYITWHITWIGYNKDVWEIVSLVYMLCLSKTLSGTHYFTITHARVNIGTVKNLIRNLTTIYMYTYMITLHDISPLFIT